jgi:hypothetical protein
MRIFSKYAHVLGRGLLTEAIDGISQGGAESLGTDGKQGDADRQGRGGGENVTLAPGVYCPDSTWALMASRMGPQPPPSTECR